MSLRYGLVVNGSAYGTQASRQAFQFAQALIEQGEILEKVFFYQDGVLNASSLILPANDEFDITKAWQALAKAHNVELETCVAAALRRGVIGYEEAEQNKVEQHNLASGFKQAGLGGLATALLTFDRVIQF
ncbi:sulfurtransferase complex subunit TusD [Aliivibrio sp. S4TY2]|uniref:Sulfurtransferase TusD homolog n=1 Tax=Aliivibrio finisterrensis TaxID=511998 RepID=A0A4Q5KQV7_9GAMM|nr:MULTISPECIES: sulfurtransferase complex subunit TusD [Aliivibrio]MDD9155943.1 sulfurtransferase complex subunit TusD [Aliivibrio sp. S4TY2]MDD9159652.1 sulfurtransferase complex subunit TusD [Aliivibrio sp. S4TY1]MDD9163652.1 sulfurtransferase complex subunit TusD [Aliivibrio sp. S4MY2]MDD9167652.1 sulfurtransferase complex subunit TusD [Aliivibrio sp. S4MY4]MDD9174846.1 sulfurtransferase complex subunit TusD [Aliivibrio sp. S3TY1]